MSKIDEIAVFMLDYQQGDYPFKPTLRNFHKNISSLQSDLK